LGDKRAVEPVLRRLDDQDDGVCVAAAATLTVLEHPQGPLAMAAFLDHNSPGRRRGAVKELAEKRDRSEKILLSHDLDAMGPWIDPMKTITDARVAEAATRLKISTQKVRSVYQTLAADFHLKLGWSTES
jgi:hypothetical protein